MPSTSTCSSAPTSTLSTASQQGVCQNTGKLDTVKQIGICVAPASSTRYPANSTATGFYNNTGPGSGATNTAAIPVGTLQSLGLMVTRFANDPSSRHQTVILHPRPLTTQARDSNSGGPLVQAGPNLRTVTSVPLGNNASIRSHQPQIHQGPHSSIQVMNLSVSNPQFIGNASHGQQGNPLKQVCQQPGRLNISSSLPLESLELVVSNDSSNHHPLRLHSESVNILNVKQGSNQGINKISKVPAVNNQQNSKMINIHGSGSSTTTNQVTRLGIIGQVPTTSSVQSVSISGSNKPIINTLTLTKPLQILNPVGSVGTNTQVHNVINMANVTSIATGVGLKAQSKTGENNSSLVAQKSLQVKQMTQVNAGPFSEPHLVSQAPSFPLNSSVKSGAPNENQNQNNVPVSVSSSSISRPNILSSPLNSPIKQSQNQNATPSSPRPSILIRKRIPNQEQAGITAISKNLSQLSSDSLVQINSTIDEKLEEERCDENSTVYGNLDTTPRKKPRKQLLEPFSLVTSHNMKLLSSSDDSSKEREEFGEGMNGSIGVIAICKNQPPRPSLLNNYSMTWKSLQYHFLRYSDVKQKSEKKLTLSDLSNEGIQKKNGWKIHHLGSQLDEIGENEHNLNERLNLFLGKFESNYELLLKSDFLPSNPHSSSDKLDDLIRGDLQRSSLFQEQICEARQLLFKLTNDHKERVGKLTKKCANKRTFITK